MEDNGLLFLHFSTLKTKEKRGQKCWDDKQCSKLAMTVFITSAKEVMFWVWFVSRITEKLLAGFHET